jgi:aryl-alcohol dehydrogenase-like predicted oxidoreductase
MKHILTTMDGSAVLPYAFGTMQFGGKADGPASRHMYDQCRAQGVTHFDTAWSYTNGQSEALLGEMIAAERGAVFVASKVAYTGGASAKNITAQFDQSRSRMQTDVIDAVYLHRFDPDVDLRHSLDALATLKQAGHIRHLGVSNFAGWQIVKAQAIASDLGVSIDLVQPMYNLVKRQAEVEILPACADQGITVAAYSPLGGGLLTGKYRSFGDHKTGHVTDEKTEARSEPQGRLTHDARYGARYGQGWMHETAAKLSEMATDIGVSAATLAVAWVAKSPWRVNPILSASGPEQLAPSLEALEFEMDDALYARISALGPTPPPATDRLEEQS